MFAHKLAVCKAKHNIQKGLDLSLFDREESGAIQGRGKRELKGGEGRETMQGQMWTVFTSLREGLISTFSCIPVLFCLFTMPLRSLCHYRRKLMLENSTAVLNVYINDCVQLGLFLDAEQHSTAIFCRRKRKMHMFGGGVSFRSTLSMQMVLIPFIGLRQQTLFIMNNACFSSVWKILI